jgi:hypothetical protein
MEEQILQQSPQPGESRPEAEVATQSPERPPDDRGLPQYGDAVGALVDDAVKRKNLATLVDVMAYQFARVIVNYGAAALAGVSTPHPGLLPQGEKEKTAEGR